MPVIDFTRNRGGEGDFLAKSNEGFRRIGSCDSLLLFACDWTSVRLRLSQKDELLTPMEPNGLEWKQKTAKKLR
jgi:hypothetical protein